MWAKGDVAVNALGVKHVQSYAMSVGAGFVGAAGAVSVWSIGTKPTSSYSSDGNGPDRGTWSPSLSYNTGDVVTYGGQRYTAKRPNKGAQPDLSAADWSPIQDSDPTNYGGGSSSQGDADTVVAGGGSGGWKSILGDAPSGSGSTPYQNRVYDTMAGTSTAVGASSSQTSPTTQRFTQPAPPSGTSAGIYGSVHSQFADVSVIATDELVVFALAGAVAGGVGAIGAGVTVLTIGLNTDAGIYSGAHIDAAGRVDVKALATERTTQIGVAGAGGFIAIAGQVAVLTDHAVQTAHVDTGSFIDRADGGLFVNARADREVSVYAIGITVGAGAAGVSVAVITIDGDARAEVGAVVLDHIGGLEVRASDRFVPTVLSIGVAGGIAVGLSGVVAVITYSGVTRAESFATGTVDGDVVVSATAERSTIAPLAVNVSTGALAVGVTVLVATSDRDTEAELGGNLSLAAVPTADVTVSASATNAVRAYTPGVSIGGAAITAMVPIATVSGHTTALLSGSVSANDVSVTVSGRQQASAQVDVIGVAGAAFNASVAIAVVTDGAEVAARVAGPASITATGAVVVSAHAARPQRGDRARQQHPGEYRRSRCRRVRRREARRRAHRGPRRRRGLVGLGAGDRERPELRPGEGATRSPVRSASASA